MKKTLSFLFIIGFFIAAKAQTYTAPFNMELQLTATGQVNNQYDSIFKYQAIITLTDTIHISKIFVKMGSEKGGNDIFDYGFSYSSHTGLPLGSLWQKNVSMITLTLGEFIAKHYYIEVYLESNTGITSEAIKWD